VDEQSGESEEEGVMDEGLGESRDEGTDARMRLS